MFGYVRPKTEELRIKDYAFYRATYCGICRRMGTLLGNASRAALTYDSVFLALLRMTLIPDDAISSRRRRCAVHPLRRRDVLNPNAAIDYTVRVFAELTYCKLVDDMSDERTLVRTAKALARPTARRARSRADLPEELRRSIRDNLARISALEAEECASADLCAAPFGELLADVFSYGVEDHACALALSELGRQMGIFIYIADAAEDYEEDFKRARFNPFQKMYRTPTLGEAQRSDIHTALLYRVGRMESALTFIPFGSREILSRLVYNIVHFGLRARIEFLKGEQK